MKPRRRRAPDVGAGQRRHRRGRRPRPPLRRAGHRPVPHRAHVPRRAPPAGRAADPGRHRRRAGDASSAALLPLQREDFVGILEAMDGLPVTIRLLDPPLHEFLPDITELSVRVARRRGARREARGRPAAAAGRAPAARAEPDARPARRAPRRRHPRAVRDAVAGDPRGRGRSGSRPAACRGSRSWCRWSPTCRSSRRSSSDIIEVAREVRAETGVHLEFLDRHDDRAAPRGADRRPDRRGGRVLLLRHQRPHPDHLGLLPRRRRGRVLLRLPGEGHLRRQPVRVASTSRASASSSASPSRRAARAVPASSSASAASTAATPTRCTSSKRSASTTSPARRSACRSPGSRPGRSVADE